MTNKSARAERQKWDESWEARATDPAFIARNVASLLPELSDGHRDARCRVEIVRAKRTGRLTVRYEFEGVATIYAKIYFDKVAAEKASDLLRHFWQNGFDSRSSYQVPEPLGYLPEEQTVFMRAARGASLIDLIAAGPIEDAARGTRAAAHWLAKFHSLTFPSLPRESMCERIGIFKLAPLLAKVSAARPEREPLLLDLLHELRCIAPTSDLPSRCVPFHGEFRAEHVFVEGDTASVIDLEGLRLSSPDKDVARFAHCVMKFSFENSRDVSRAVHMVDEFLREYEALASEALTHVPYFRAFYSLKELAKAMKSRGIEEHERGTHEEFYLAEFNRNLQESQARSAAA
jgi:hypothetical protein